MSGKLTDERFMKMSQRYDEEQQQLKKDIEVRAAPFSLPGFADKILNRHTLAAVQHHVLRVFLYLRAPKK